LLPKSLITVAANSSEDNTLIGKAFGVTSRDERPCSVLVLNISDIELEIYKTWATAKRNKRQ
jgi:hypothetical protein